MAYPKVILEFSTSPSFSDIYWKQTIQLDTYVTNKTLLVSDFADSIDTGKLIYGDVYIRAKYIEGDYGDSDYSDAVKLSIVRPTEIIGVCFDNTSIPGTFSWIDEYGNRLTSFDYQSHPCYRLVTEQTLTIQRSSPDFAVESTFIAIPKFYIRTALTGPVGSFAEGKKCWWLSNQPYAGFRAHSMFKRVRNSDTSSAVDKVYIGKYLGSSIDMSSADGNLSFLVSRPDMEVLSSITIDTAETLASNHNNTYDNLRNRTKAHIMDIYHWGGLKYLGLIAMCGGDSEGFWGTNTIGENPITGTTNAKFIFKGTNANPQVYIDDAWNCYCCWTDLISVKDGKLQLKKPWYGLNYDEVDRVNFTTAIDASKYTISAIESGKYFNDVMDCPFTLGNEVHDLMELFLPKTPAANILQAAFKDFGFFVNNNNNTEYVVHSGGWPAGDERSGLFSIAGNAARNIANTYIGARLCYTY